MKMEKLTYDEFIKKYRDVGFGFITITSINEKGEKEVDVMETKEVLCDICNKIIIPDDIVYIVDDNLLCEECKEKRKS